MGFVSCVHPPGMVSFSKELRHEVVESLKTRDQHVKTLRGLATVRYGAKLFGARGETAILLRRPYDLRIDGLSEFGLNENQVVLSRGELLITWGREKRYFKGLAGREVLARYLSVPLDPESVIQILSGVVPLEEEEDYFLKIRKKGTEFVLRGRSSELVVIKRDSFYLPLQYAFFGVDGSRDSVVTYADYEESGSSFLFPRRLTARIWDLWSERATGIEVRFHEVDLNPSIENNLFELKIPDDANSISD